MSLTVYAVGIVLIVILVAVVHFRAKTKTKPKKPVGPTSTCRYVWTPWNGVDSVATLQAKALGAAEGRIPLLMRDGGRAPFVAYVGGYSTDMKTFMIYGGGQTQVVKPGQTWYLAGAGTSCPKTLALGTALGPHLMGLPGTGAFKEPEAVGYFFPNGGSFGDTSHADFGFVRTGSK